MARVCPDCGCDLDSHTVNSFTVAGELWYVLHCGSCGTCWKTRGNSPQRHVLAGYETPYVEDDHGDTTDREPTPVCQSCSHSVGAHDRDGICSLCNDDDVCGAATPTDMDAEPEDTPGEYIYFRGQRVGNRGDY